MSEYFKKYHSQLSLIAILLLFVIVKLPALSLPFFWDELGVYARSGLYLHDNGLGLLPANLPPELSRGHPLLFSFIHGLGFLIFGDTTTGGHITALIIAITLLWSVYYITRYHYTANSGLLAVMLLIVQPLFFAQSTLIIPEVCVGLFMLWAIHFWVIKSFWGYALMATCAILIKESAVIIPTVIIASEVFIYLISKVKARPNLFKLSNLLLFSPYLIYILFLLIQKQQNGWYLFPLHEQLIAVNGAAILAFAEMFFSFLFLEQGRIVLFLIVIIFLVLFIKCELFKFSRFTVFLWMLIFGGILFSSFNFFMNRYLLFAFIPIVMLIAVLITTTSARYRFSLIFIPLIFAACVYSMYGKNIYSVNTIGINKTEEFLYDENMSYVNYLAIQQQAINYLMTKVAADEVIASNFPTNVAISDPRLGFTDKVVYEDFVVKWVGNPSEDFDYLLLSNPGSFDKIWPPLDSLEEVFSIKTPQTEFNVYIRANTVD